MKDGGGGCEHRHVDEAGDAHGDHHVDQFEVEDLAACPWRGAHDSLLGECGVQVDDVWHDGRAEDADCQQERLAPIEVGNERAFGDAAPGWAGVEHLDAEGGDDDADQDGDRGLEAAEPERLQGKDRKRDHAG